MGVNAEKKCKDNTGFVWEITPRPKINETWVECIELSFVGLPKFKNGSDTPDQYTQVKSVLLKLGNTKCDH